MWYVRKKEATHYFISFQYILSSFFKLCTNLNTNIASHVCCHVVVRSFVYRLSDIYDTSSKQRIPSWTDRILYKETEPSLTTSSTSSSSNNIIKLLCYCSAPELRISDHRPVYAGFIASVELDTSTREEQQRDTDERASPNNDEDEPNNDPFETPHESQHEHTCPYSREGQHRSMIVRQIRTQAAISSVCVIS
jgi:hypothetical protein